MAVWGVRPRPAGLGAASEVSVFVCGWGGLDIGQLVV